MIVDRTLPMVLLFVAPALSAQPQAWGKHRRQRKYKHMAIG